MRQESSCRLCGGSTAEIFRKNVLSRHDVVYEECQNCQSVQTEKPYWLAESYSDGNLAVKDTGAAQRVLTNWALTLFVARILGARCLLDFGGGDGLLCRLLRDNGLDAYSTDRFAKATYGAGFQKVPAETIDLLTAFEVLEHLPEPAKDLCEILSLSPRSFLGSTGIYRKQDENWWYFAPQTGQHVFFYSDSGIEQLARMSGYFSFVRGNYFLLTKKKLGFFNKLFFSVLFRSKVVVLLRCIMPLLNTPGVVADSESL